MTPLKALSSYSAYYLFPLNLRALVLLYPLRNITPPHRDTFHLNQPTNRRTNKRHKLVVPGLGEAAEMPPPVGSPLRNRQSPSSSIGSNSPRSRASSSMSKVSVCGITRNLVLGSERL